MRRNWARKESLPDMVHSPPDTAVTMSPQLVQAVRTTNRLSPAERLFLAKTLLDRLVADEIQTSAAPSTDELPTLTEVVAQIKATPPNPHQIQRATKTVDEVFATWEESPVEEPPLTTTEWEQNWWAIRQAMQRRDQHLDPLSHQLIDDHG